MFPICHLRRKLGTFLLSFIGGPELPTREASLSLAEVMELICIIPVIPMSFIPGPAAVPLDVREDVHPLHHLHPLLPHHPVPEAVLRLCPLAEVTEGGGEHEQMFECNASRMHVSESSES